MQSHSLIQENSVSQRQHQQLLINLAMKQAFHVLQLPMLELSAWMKEEIETNPMLDLDMSKESFKERLEEPFNRSSKRSWQQRHKEHQDNLLTAPISLFEHLMKQIPLVLESPQDLHLAELLIGHLNEKGYLDVPLESIAPFAPLPLLEKILSVIQSLDPPGVGAADLRECLLIQLKLKQKEGSLAAKIISQHFEELLQNRLPQISQRLKVPLSVLSSTIKKEIAPLDLYPGYRFCHQPQATIIPDLIFLCFDGKWHIEINTSFLPHFRIAPSYLEALRNDSLGSQECEFLRKKLAGGKWLKRIVQRRNQTLSQLGEFLLKKQRPFFTEKAKLVPLTMQEAAAELNVHESTIARAVANKYLACPLGTFSLRSFFNQGITTQNGQKISNRSLREMLARTIQNEDKSEPMSDERLARHFKKLGIPCARRTIAKYRSTLNISSAAKRKEWH